MRRARPQDLTYPVFMINVREHIHRAGRFTGCPCRGTGFCPVYLDGEPDAVDTRPDSYDFPCPKCGAEPPDTLPIYFEDPRPPRPRRAGLTGRRY